MLIQVSELCEDCISSMTGSCLSNSTTSSSNGVGEISRSARTLDCSSTSFSAVVSTSDLASTSSLCWRSSSWTMQSASLKPTIFWTTLSCFSLVHQDLHESWQDENVRAGLISAHNLLLPRIFRMIDKRKLLFLMTRSRYNTFIVL